jgi:dolichyl-diphosphooligosaccharide--protein glycosyltransferase
VLALSGVALWFRSAGAYDNVIREDGVFLQGADAWHHLRQVEQLVRHYPARMGFDPYALHPGGQGVAVAPLFDYVAATLALLAGAFSPSARTVAAVTAWLPAILGALTCVPAYLIARRTAGRAAGLLAAVCVAVLPGQLLSRTVLGFSDHHALEALLAPLTVLALLRALSRDDRRTALRDAALAGGVLLLYLLSWVGGALLVLVLGAWAVVQVNVDHARGRGGGRSAAVAAACFGTALLGQTLLGWGLPYAGYQRLALVGALASAAALGWLATWLTRGGRSRVHLPMATLAIALAAGVTLAQVSPGTLRGGWRALTWFAGSGLQQTVGEAAPLLLPNGELSFRMAWTHYGTALPGAAIALVLLVRRVVRECRAGDTLVTVWSGSMLLATLGQNRFGYYFAVCAAVLCGTLIGPPLARLWDARDGEVPVWIRRGLWPFAAVVGLVVPVAPVAAATSITFQGPRDAWIGALTFLREETPEPFGDAGLYERLVDRDAHEARGDGVLAWWDGGYWITALARRVPAANPTQAGAREAARLLLLTSPDAAAAACREQRLRYVVVGGETPIMPIGPDQLGGEIGQMARWAGIDREELYRTYHHRAEDGSWQPIVLFEPAYFETLAVRLHVFQGAENAAQTCLVVHWEDVPDDAGGVRREITDMQRFESFERAARRYEKALDEGATNVGLVSDDPLASCVPLGSAHGFRRVFASEQPALVRMFQPLPDVQVYEVVE